MLVTEETAGPALERVARCDALVVDTETTGLETWKDDRVCGVAVAADGETFYFPFRHGDGANLSPARYRQLLGALSGKTLAGFHLRFDIEMLHRDGFALPPKIQDTLIAAILMNENEPTFALKKSRDGRPGLAPRYLGPDAVAEDSALEETLVSRGFTKGDIWRLPASMVAEYAEADVVLPAKLMERVYLPALEKWGCGGVFQEYCDYQRLLIAMECRGIPLDMACVESALVEGEAARGALLKRIQEEAGYPLNPNSPKQVAAACGTANAQEETLARSGHPLAASITEYKAYTKRDSAYLRRFRENADTESRLHVQLNLTMNEQGFGGTRSGRLSCSRPNLQAMPKPATHPVYAPCRQAVLAPPGMTLIEADYAQAEVRIAGHYSREPELLRAFAENRDLYQESAEALGVSRYDAKILFLAIQYGAGTWKISEMLGIPVEHATELRDKWHARFSRIKKAMYRTSDFAESNGCIRLWEGRWAHFDGSKKSATCKSPFYTAWNRLIQGSVAGMIRIAMQRLWAPLAGMGGHMLLQVHDSILFCVPTSAVREASETITQVMEDFPQWTIPPKVELKTGQTWLTLS